MVLDNSSTYNLPHSPGEVVGPWVVGAGASVGAWVVGAAPPHAVASSICLKIYSTYIIINYF